MQASTLTIASRLRAPAGGLEVDGRFYRGGAYLPESARQALEVVASKAARVSVAEPVEVGILGYVYTVRSVPISASVGTVAFLVTPKHKPTEAYHLHHDVQGETVCSCADWEYRRKGTGPPCKHTARLIELGLIPASRPIVLPPLRYRTSTDRPWVAPTPTDRNPFEPTTEERQEAAVLLNC